MYIKRTKSKGHEYLYLVEEVYAQGRKQIKTVKALGRVDQMSPEQLQSLLDQPLDQRKLQMSKMAQAAEFVTHMQQSQEPLEQSLFGLHLGYGHLIAWQVWSRYLNLPYQLDYLQKNYTDITAYKASNIVFSLVASKMMQPASYLSTFDNRLTLIANRMGNSELRYVYDALGFLSRFKDRIMESVYQNLSKSMELGKPLLLFFDCTNFYFEVTYDSREEFIMDFRNDRTLQLMNEGKGQEEITSFLNSPDFSAELQAAIHRAEEQGLFVRMRGPSKEGRYAQPLMGMSLVIDEHGFPLDFEVFPGNESEYGYLPKAVQSIKDKYHITQAYYVADRGLNSSANLDFIRQNKMGFIVAQKVSQQTKAQRSEMLSDEGWKTLDLSKDLWAASLVQDVDGCSYRYKICDYQKQSFVHYTDADGQTKRRKIVVDCKIIYTFSKKRKRRDELVIETLTAKAQEAIDAGRLMSNPNGSGWRSLVLTEAEQAGAKKDKDMYRACSLNKAKIDKLKEIAGYAALVFLPPAGLENTEESMAITAQKGYKHLVSIEANFRAMKSDLQLRPVFLKRTDRTIGHCMVCMLSLTMLKTIQYNLRQIGEDVSLGKIQQILQQAHVLAIPLDSSSKPIFIHGLNFRTDTAKEHRAHNKTGQANPIPANQNAALLDQLIKLAHLSPLHFVESAGSIRHKLKIDPRIPLLSEAQIVNLAKLASHL